MPKELLNGGVSSKKEIQKVFLFKTQTLNTRDTKKLPSFSSFRYIFSPHFYRERDSRERREWTNSKRPARWRKKKNSRRHRYRLDDGRLLCARR
jgi:hypothetical protein